MYEVTVTDWFSAAHQLRLPDGTLEPLHGHNWQVSATFVGPDLDGMGVLLDFVALKARVRELLATMHDTHLNELAPFQALPPSAEGVARHIADELADFGGDTARLAVVAVEESPGCVARYRPPSAAS